MKKQMVKCMKHISFVFLTGVVSYFCLQTIQALEGSSVSYPLNSYHQNDYDTLWRTGFTIIDTIHGKAAWCLEPDIVTANAYYSTKEYPLVHNNGYYWKNGRKRISHEESEMLGLIAYYGYYATHQTEFDRCLTQSAIWYYLSDDTLKEKAILRNTNNVNINYEKEILEIIEKANLHTQNKPFDGTELVLHTGESQTLISTGTLSYFKVMVDAGIQAVIDENRLIISVTDDFVEGNIYLINDANLQDEENLFWLSNLNNPAQSYQVLVSPTYQGEDVVSTIKVRAESESITLLKSTYRFIKKEYLETIQSTSKWSEESQKAYLKDMIDKDIASQKHSYSYEEIKKSKEELFIPSKQSNLEWIRKHYS